MGKATAKAVDFSGVKDRGNFNPKRVLEGDYAAVITKVEDGESKKDPGSFQYIFTIKLEKFSQNSYPYYCKIQDNQLWKLRNIAIAAGLNVPKKRMKFDPNKVVNKKIGVTMEDDEYEGKEKSVIGAVFPIAELLDGVVEDDTSDEAFDDGEPQMAGDDSFDPEDEAGTDEEKPKKKKDKGDSGKKKKKKKKAKEGEVEDLDISDVD